MILRLENVTKRFGGVVAVADCTLALPEGILCGLVGPNGSGKTTLFNLIAGVLRPDAGQILYEETRIDGLRPHKIVRLGLGRTFQTTRLFASLDVRQNVMLGDQSSASTFEKERKASSRLEDFGIAGLSDTRAGDLSFGQQRLVELARTLMGEPRLIILDEPFAGLAPTMVDELAAHLRSLHEQGVTLLLVEHNLELVISLCSHLFVLETGRVIAQGPPDEVCRMPPVIDAYLGTELDFTGTGDAAAH